MPALEVILSQLFDLLAVGICFLWIGGMVALTAWLVVYLRRKEKQRGEDMRGVAEQLGLPYCRKGNARLISELSRFKLFSQFESKQIAPRFKSQQITHVLHGQTEDVEVGIFDYADERGDGISCQSVVYLRSPLIKLPEFALHPEDCLVRIGKVFGYQNINFESHQAFSQAFILRGSDEARIRKVFNGEVLSFFEVLTGVCVEGSGDRLIFYRDSVRVEPAKIQSFMDEGFTVYRLLCSRS